MSIARWVTAGGVAVIFVLQVVIMRRSRQVHDQNVNLFNQRAAMQAQLDVVRRKVDYLGQVVADELGPEFHWPPSAEFLGQRGDPLAELLRREAAAALDEHVRRARQSPDDPTGLPIVPPLIMGRGVVPDEHPRGADS